MYVAKDLANQSTNMDRLHSETSYRTVKTWKYFKGREPPPFKEKSPLEEMDPSKNVRI